MGIKRKLSEESSSDEEVVTALFHINLIGLGVLSVHFSVEHFCVYIASDGSQHKGVLLISTFISRNAEGEILVSGGSGECEVSESEEAYIDGTVFSGKVKRFGVILVVRDVLSVLYGGHTCGISQVGLVQREDTSALVLHIHEVEYVQVSSLPSEFFHVSGVGGRNVNLFTINLDVVGCNVNVVGLGEVHEAFQNGRVNYGSDSLDAFNLSVLADLGDKSRV